MKKIFNIYIIRNQYLYILNNKINYHLLEIYFEKY